MDAITTVVKLVKSGKLHTQEQMISENNPLSKAIIYSNRSESLFVLLTTVFASARIHLS